MLQAAVALAQSSRRSTPVKLAELAARTGIPRAYAPQVLGDLTRASLATSVLGAHGGYRLSRDPSLVNLLEIVEAVEGELGVEHCPLSDEPCPPGRLCPVHETLDRARLGLRERLAALSLADLLVLPSLVESGHRAGDPVPVSGDRPACRLAIADESG